MNRVRSTPTRRRRVYTFRAAWLAVLLLLGLMGGATAQSTPEAGTDPAMTKGAPTAPVTIVEFSDYQ